jgi:uncharacterized protein (TIGR02466 family)
MLNVETYNLFPIPVTRIGFDPIDENTMNFIKSIDYEVGGAWTIYPNNTIQEKNLSSSKKVLDDYPELTELKKIALDTARIYWDTVICGDENLELEITNSWFTRHFPGEKKPSHIHAAIFSGTFYLEVSENCGDIIFYKDNNYLNLFPSLIDIDFHTFNLINVKRFRLAPEKNTAVFFPGHLNHEVDANLSDKIRYVLTADYKIKGTTRKDSGGYELHY